MPRQKPGSSNQDVGTPPALLEAVIARFGPIAYDMAADRSNHVVRLWCGPGTCWEDGLEAPWSKIVHGGWAWVNPPFGELVRWSAKCAAEHELGARILLLAPAAVGSEWFARNVEGRAYVYALRPRVTFVGHTAPYPKDLLLCAYDLATGFRSWRWRP